MASISYFIPNELSKRIDDSSKGNGKESRLNYEPKQVDKMMICIQHKKEAEAAAPLDKKMMMTSLNDDQQQQDDKDEEDEGEVFFTYEEEQEWYEEQRRWLAWDQAFERDLLDGALAPSPLPLAAPISQSHSPSPVDDTSFITKEGYINHSLVAARAVHELSTLALDNNGFFWTNDGILNQQHYQQTFPKPTPPNATSSWTHASRASAVVNMEHIHLVKMLTTHGKWAKLFPSIVSKVVGLRFLFQGSSSRNPDGSLQLIYTELQAPTPYVPKRTFAFLRTCKQIDQLTWVVADISIDRSRNIGFPCGCLIQGIGDGFSQVIWVDHLEFEENYLDHKLYMDLSCIGFAFGAERWVACLERSCERRSYKAKTGILVPCLVGQEDPWQYEKKCVMRLSQRMVRGFCLNIGPSDNPSPRISCVPALRNMQIRTALDQSPYHDDPKEMVLISSATISLPHSPEFILEILGDEHRRHEWDVTGKISRFKKPTCYITGIDSRNKISVYQTHSWMGDEVVLQEASVNRSGSLLVWSVLKSKESDFARIDRGPLSRLPLIGLSGLAISSNSHPNTTSSSNTGGGSIVTLCVQQEVHDIMELDPKTLDFAKKHIIKVALRIEAVLIKAAARTF